MSALSLMCVVWDSTRHTGDGWSNVRSRPERPVQIDSRTSGDGRGHVGRGRSNNTVGGVSTTLKVLGGQVRHGSVALDGTGDSLGCGARVRIGVRLVEGVR